jgi:hypothetical protein
MMNLETWLTQFAAGAGPTYVWGLLGNGMLRTWLDTGEEAGWECPLLAQTTLDYGQLFPPADHLMLWQLAKEDRWRVIAAADNGPAWMLIPELRQRLLRLCGLHDTVA